MCILDILLRAKRGRVFPTVIWPANRMGQYRVNDHPYNAPQFSTTVPASQHKLINPPQCRLFRLCIVSTIMKP